MPSIDYMIEYFPLMKSRLYSIASAQEMLKNKLELTVTLNFWNTPSGKYREGTCSSYLKNLVPGKDKIWCKF